MARAVRARHAGSRRHRSESAIRSTVALMAWRFEDCVLDLRKLCYLTRDDQLDLYLGALTDAGVPAS
jgi:hypothetical protein